MGVFQVAMEREMSLRGFAPRTQDVYARWMRRLVRFGRVRADKVTEAQVRDFRIVAASLPPELRIRSP